MSFLLLAVNQNRHGEDIWPPGSSLFQLCSGLRFTWTLLSSNRTRSDRQQAPTQFTADSKTTAFSCFSTITIFIISSFFWLCCPEPWPGHLSHTPVMNEPQNRQLAGSRFSLRGEQLSEIVTNCDDNTTRRPCSKQLIQGDTWMEAVFMFLLLQCVLVSDVSGRWLTFSPPAFLNHLSDQSRTICVAVSEKWRFRRLSRLKKKKKIEIFRPKQYYHSFLECR